MRGDILPAVLLLLHLAFLGGLGCAATDNTNTDAAGDEEQEETDDGATDDDGEASANEGDWPCGEDPAPGSAVTEAVIADTCSCLDETDNLEADQTAEDCQEFIAASCTEVENISECYSRIEAERDNNEEGAGEEGGGGPDFSEYPCDDPAESDPVTDSNIEALCECLGNEEILPEGTAPSVCVAENASLCDGLETMGECYEALPYDD